MNQINVTPTRLRLQDLAVASVPEFIPRGIPSTNYAKNATEPEIVEILHSESTAVGGELLNPPYDDPNIATYQVGFKSH